MTERTFTCAECGFDASGLSDADLVSACTSFVRKYRPPLTRFLPGEDGPSIVRRRPAPDVWSALEYAAHTRDVFDFYRERIERVLAEDRPMLRAVGFRDLAETAVYNEQDPAAVADGVTGAAAALASTLGGLDGEGWARIGLASGGSGDERSVRLLAERAVHDAAHHLLDIGRSLRAARTA